MYDKIITLFFGKNIIGKTILYQTLIAFGFKKLIKFKCKYGFYIEVCPFEYIDSIIIKEGFYESEVFDAILSRTSKDKNDIFWDIGSNIGIHSIGLKFINPKIQVFAFEPAPYMMSRIMKNEQLNNLKINKISVPLFSRHEIFRLNLMQGNPGMTTLIPTEGTYYNDTTTVFSSKGDTLIQSDYIEIPNIIKIDTEGSELQILEGCKEILRNKKLHTIIFESGNNALEENNQIIQLLQKFNFNISKLARNEVSTSHGLSNYLAVR